MLTPNTVVKEPLTKDNPECWVDVLEGGEFIRRPLDWYSALSTDQRVALRVKRSLEAGNIFQLSGLRAQSMRTRV